MGRELRYIRLKTGEDFGLMLVKDGYCSDYSLEFPHPREKKYQKVQDKAKAKRLGIWK